MKTKKAKRSRQRVEYRSFTFRILDWKPSYSFSTQLSRFGPGPYWEHTSLILTGSCVSPRKFDGREGPLTILGQRDYVGPLMTHDDDGRGRLGVGGLTLRGEKTDFLGSMPSGLAGTEASY